MFKEFHLTMNVNALSSYVLHTVSATQDKVEFESISDKMIFKRKYLIPMLMSVKAPGLPQSKVAGKCVCYINRTSDNCCYKTALIWIDSSYNNNTELFQLIAQFDNGSYTGIIFKEENLQKILEAAIEEDTYDRL
jgi:hypothetical protein